MKTILSLLLCINGAVMAAGAQVEYVAGSYFPAEQEFPELQKVKSRESFEDAAELKRVDSGKLFADVGFEKYARRVYSVGASGSLSVEIVTLLDSRAAYSLLTLLRDSAVQTGPPGDAFTKTADGIRFSQKKVWVRIVGKDVPADLPVKVATSISNRIGPDRGKPPSLVARIPAGGLDASTLRYFPGNKAFISSSGMIAGQPTPPELDFEIVQARYSVNSQAGVLSLISFPTPEVADDYYSTISGEAAKGAKVYAKKAGHLIGVLEGGFSPESAGKLLNSIEFTYSVRWIYEKEEKPKIVWGIPGGILATVVKSFFFVIVLGGFSILVGVVIAYIRGSLRRRIQKKSPGGRDPEETTHLRMR